MADSSFFTNLFDISVRDQVSLALSNSASDTFFLLSGPPSFSDLSKSGAASSQDTAEAGQFDDYASLLCPLLFSQSFVDSEQKMPDQQIGSLGTSNTVTAPSGATVTSKTITVQAAAYVTAKPFAGDSQEKAVRRTGLLAPQYLLNGKPHCWNMLKRLYYWLITDSDFGPQIAEAYIGNEAKKPWAVAPEYTAPWGNFAKSDLYKIPFGIMAVVASKDRSPLKITYYEGCVLQGAGYAELSATLQQPVTFAGTGGFQTTFTKRVTFNDEQCKLIAGTGTDSSGRGNLFQQLLKAYGGSI